MLITILKSKIHMATITGVFPDYEGSVGIDPALIKASGLVPGEKVHVLNADNAIRLETYVIEGEKGEISLRGPAARLGKKGERVVILAYGHADQKEARRIRPKIVRVNNRNAIIRRHP